MGGSTTTACALRSLRVPVVGVVLMPSNGQLSWPCLDIHLRELSARTGPFVPPSKNDLMSIVFLEASSGRELSWSASAPHKFGWRWQSWPYVSLRDTILCQALNFGGPLSHDGLTEVATRLGTPAWVLPRSARRSVRVDLRQHGVRTLGCFDKGRSAGPRKPAPIEGGRRSSASAAMGRSFFWAQPADLRLQRSTYFKLWSIPGFGHGGIRILQVCCTSQLQGPWTLPRTLTKSKLEFVNSEANHLQDDGDFDFHFSSFEEARARGGDFLATASARVRATEDPNPKPDLQTQGWIVSRPIQGRGTESLAGKGQMPPSVSLAQTLITRWQGSTSAFIHRRSAHLRHCQVRRHWSHT